LAVLLAPLSNNSFRTFQDKKSSWFRERTPFFKGSLIKIKGTVDGRNPAKQLRLVFYPVDTTQIQRDNDGR